MGSPDAVANAEICLHQNFDSLDLWPDINGNCVPSLEGKELMEEMGRQTDALDPKLETAPYVTIGSKYTKNAGVNLIQALCDAYPMVKAPLCATLPNYAVKVGIYFSGNAAAQKLFIEQLQPFYNEIIPVLRDGTSESKLHALIIPEIVAWGATKYDKDNTENPFTCDTPNECYINRFFVSDATKNWRYSIINHFLCFTTDLRYSLPRIRAPGNVAPDGADPLLLCKCRCFE